mmetsp:Transcript_118890/g.337088  ORF Transcript_118890/g.337088 Transcript_118890/m.337088 type:complete len:223 (+) Transcript_118890:128-796(+)
MSAGACDPVDVTYKSADDLRKHMARFDPALMCIRETGKGVPAGWLLSGHTKQTLGDLLKKAYTQWDRDVTLTFEAPPAECEYEGLSPRSREGLELCNAAYEGDGEKVTRFLNQRIDVDVRIKRKGMNTPLNLACRSGHADIIKLLLERQAEVDARNDFKETPLMCAANRARGSVCRLLLDRSADVHAIDENGDNALDFLGAGNSERKKDCREILRRAGCQRR